MADVLAQGTEIETRFLRGLTIDPKFHPRAQPYISAASGLVCAYGRAYVISDDEHHIAVFSDHDSLGELYRIVPDNLPAGKQARKLRKPDFEILLRLPDRTVHGGGLVALGSGSRRNRQKGVFIPLDEQGVPSNRVRMFDLAPLYRPLRTILGEINVEGALVIDDELLLLNRGVGHRSDNAMARYRRADLGELIEGKRSDIEPIELRRYNLGAIDGIGLGFTDGAAVPGGGWVFTAVAENTNDSFKDGPCAGAAVGWVDAKGALHAVHPLKPPLKAEGIDIQVVDNAMWICLVTDSDDPGQCSRMWLAQP